MSLNEAGRVQLQSNLPSVVSFRLLDRFGIHLICKHILKITKIPTTRTKRILYIQQDLEIFCRIDPCGTPASSLTNEVTLFYNNVLTNQIVFNKSEQNGIIGPLTSFQN